MLKVNLKELKSNIFQLLLVALAFLVIVSFIAFLFSKEKSFAISDLGSFGDFFGGILNPIFAFLAFVALLTTIVLQASELKATRKELKKSAKALKKQSESLKLQNQATKLQIFENTFFQLVHMFSDIKKNIMIKPSSLTNFLNDGQRFFLNGKLYTLDIRIFNSEDELNSHNAISMYMLILKKLFNNDYSKFNFEYEKDTGVYFGQIYQILKFIDNSNNENKQRYVNIFRAQFTKDELEFLFYHCLGNIGKRKFKKLVEDYEFFEHLILNADIEKQVLEYNIKAFGKNENIIKKYDELLKEKKPQALA